MLQTLESSSPAAAILSQENQILADIEGMLSDYSADRGESSRDRDHARGTWAKRIVLLAGVGAMLALLPIGLKPGMVTGRSVAHSSGQ